MEAGYASCDEDLRTDEIPLQTVFFPIVEIVGRKHHDDIDVLKSLQEYLDGALKDCLSGKVQELFREGTSHSCAAARSHYYNIFFSHSVLIGRALIFHCLYFMTKRYGQI